VLHRQELRIEPDDRPRVAPGLNGRHFLDARFDAVNLADRGLAMQRQMQLTKSPFARYRQIDLLQVFQIFRVGFGQPILDGFYTNQCLDRRGKPLNDLGHILCPYSCCFTTAADRGAGRNVR
jgi:hypothetical protein